MLYTILMKDNAIDNYENRVLIKVYEEYKKNKKKIDVSFILRI